jgi:hypothetical protein
MNRHWLDSVRHVPYWIRKEGEYTVGYIHLELLPRHWKAMTLAKFRHTMRRIIRRKYPHMNLVFDTYPSTELILNYWGNFAFHVAIKFRDPSDELAFCWTYPLEKRDV